jgi:hypothetical protein
VEEDCCGRFSSIDRCWRGHHKSERFNVPFEITNDGYLPVKVQVFSYLQSYDSVNFHLEKSLMKDFGWKGGTLQPREKETVIVHFLDGFGSPRKADLAIALNYKTFGVACRAVHRFVGQYEGSWYWLSEPSSAIRKDLDEKAKQYSWMTED